MLQMEALRWTPFLRTQPVLRWVVLTLLIGWCGAWGSLVGLRMGGWDSLGQESAGAEVHESGAQMRAACEPLTPVYIASYHVHTSFYFNTSHHAPAGEPAAVERRTSRLGGCVLRQQDTDPARVRTFGYVPQPGPHACIPIQGAQQPCRWAAVCGHGLCGVRLTARLSFRCGAECLLPSLNDSGFGLLPCGCAPTGQMRIRCVGLCGDPAHLGC